MDLFPVKNNNACKKGESALMVTERTTDYTEIWRKSVGKAMGGLHMGDAGKPLVLAVT